MARVGPDSNGVHAGGAKTGMGKTNEGARAR